MPLPTTTKILILSHQVLYQEALKSLLSHLSEENIVEGYSPKNSRIREIISEFSPSIILLDANGMGNEVWDFLLELRHLFAETRFIMLANTNESIYQEYASKNGASGYVLKSSPKEILIGAIKIVMKGGVFFDPGTNNHIRVRERVNADKTFNLSDREMEIVTLIKDGFSTKDIAHRLQLSFHTIETHRKNIYNKLNIKKVTQLISMFSDLKAS